MSPSGNSPATASDPWLGRVIGGRWKILSLLDDSGGMASVYLADDTRLERKAVVKIPKAAHLNAEFAERFAREAKWHAQVENTHVVHILDRGEEAGTPFLVLQYLPGGNLKAWCTRNASMLSDPRLHFEAWLFPVAHALDAVAAKGIVHRDVKPTNILFDADGRGYLSDFGIVKAGSEATLTGTGLFIGTLQFMSPEQCQKDGKRTLDGRSDQYGLAVTVYQVLTGWKYPVDDDDTAVVYAAKFGFEAMTQPRAHVPLVPQAVNDAVMRALSPDREKRFATSVEFAEAVLAGFGSLGERRATVRGTVSAKPGAGPTSLLATERPSPSAADTTSRRTSVAIGQPAQAGSPPLASPTHKWSLTKRLGVGVVVAALLVAGFLLGRKGEQRDDDGGLLEEPRRIGGIADGSVITPSARLPDATMAAGVFVSDPTEREFPATREAVARALETSRRTYRVVVVDRVGDAGDARGLLDRLLDRWQKRGDRAYDPAADVTILVATKDRSLAMDVPRALRDESGLDAVTIASSLIDAAFVPHAEDGFFDEGLAALVDETEAAVRRQAEDRQARAEAARRFRTRTLPLGIAGMTGAGAVLALALQWARHARRLAAARTKLAAFKADVVALSDMLDAQQERHRMLPHADPDFRTPMEGLTRTAYEGVQEAIARYRERWLGLMDVWERAQKKVDSEWWLGTAAADDALRLLDSAEARPPLDEVAGSCRGPLDALEMAHEKARELLAAIDTETANAATRLDGLARRGRSHAPFQAALAAVARGRDRAAALVERDPVAARGQIEQSTAALAATLQQVEAVEVADDRRRRAIERADALAADVARRRAEGWLLDEPGANPDDRIVAGRSACDLAAQLLDSGDAAGAGACLERGERACGEAAALVENIVAARARVEELAAPAAARLEALVTASGIAAQTIAHLQRSYAEACWSDVAGNVTRFDEVLDRVRTLLAEARAAADPARQHSLRAVALLEEAGGQEDWVAGCQEAIAERRGRLDGLRTTLPGRRDGVAARVGGLARQLQRQRTDRARANERCREAARILEAADAALAVARPDVLEAQRLVTAADEAAARGAELAAEDERLARQATSDIAETGALVRRVAAWYDEGVQPDVHEATRMLESAAELLERQRYEDAIRTSGEAALSARAAYATATAEAERRRTQRLQEIQRRRLEESFRRSADGCGPWVITLPGGRCSGPSPWRTLGPPAAPSRSVGAGWSRDIAQVNW